MAVTQKIKKRNGEIADFQPHKITIAVQKEFAAVLGDSHETDAADITRVVVDSIDAKYGNTAFIPSVEDIQDLVETALMERGYFTVAKDYIIYRYEHTKAREEKKAEIAEKIEENQLLITKRDGSRENFSEAKLTRTLIRSCIGYEHIIDVPSVIARGVELGQFDKRMMDFDLPRLADALQLDRDREFKYLGLQTLLANYLSKEHATRKLLETPQIFWMRVAMGCAIVEKTPEDRNRYAIEFYEAMSSMHYTPSSPTLYHAGLALPQLSSCFLSTVPDDLHAIFDEYKDGAQLLKYAGGLGVDWSAVRATGSMVKKTGVESQGVIPFLKIANDVTISINRSGRRRAHDLNTAVWIPDLFMKRLQEDGYWTLFSPSDVPDLHDLYGKKFDAAYIAYEARAEAGEIPHHKRLRATDLWRKHLTMLFESGHPWITWKDPCNVRSPQDHCGVRCKGPSM